MKIKSRNRFQRFLQPPRLRRSDIALTLIPALLWIGATQARDRVIETRCATQPELCSRAAVPRIDRVALGMNSSEADLASYYTQNLSGVFGLFVPAAIAATKGALSAISPAEAAAQAGSDFVIWLETVLWNGALNEGTKVIVQRPRPFVYGNPTDLGADPANYVSFYSGHTSFSAASCVALFLILLGRSAPLWALVLTAIGGNALIVMTAVFRVLAGRHFVTDVLAGIAAGALTALVVSYLHKPQASAELGIQKGPTLA